jgi:hypothetical protein
MSIRSINVIVVIDEEEVNTSKSETFLGVSGLAEGERKASQKALSESSDGGLVVFIEIDIVLIDASRCSTRSCRYGNDRPANQGAP